jgi:hypothetical protein
MPSTNCPHCGRTGIPFELHEAHTVFECAKCGGKFTPMDGAVFQDRSDSLTTARPDTAPTELASDCEPEEEGESYLPRPDTSPVNHQRRTTALIAASIVLASSLVCAGVLVFVFHSAERRPIPPMPAESMRARKSITPAVRVESRIPRTETNRPVVDDDLDPRASPRASPSANPSSLSRTILPAPPIAPPARRNRLHPPSNTVPREGIMGIVGEGVKGARDQRVSWWVGKGGTILPGPLDPLTGYTVPFDPNVGWGLASQPELGKTYSGDIHAAAERAALDELRREGIDTDGVVIDRKGLPPLPPARGMLVPRRSDPYGDWHFSGRFSLEGTTAIGYWTVNLKCRPGNKPGEIVWEVASVYVKRPGANTITRTAPAASK